MSELVELGHQRLAGEVVALRTDRLTVQVYEYSGGVAPGDPVRALGRPLAVPLGPGLLGSVFDGLLRPLGDAPVWLPPRSIEVAGDHTWTYIPVAREGDLVGPGTVLGSVEDIGPLAHRVLVPPEVTGRLEWIRAQGPCPPGESVATVDGHDIGLVEWWPIRRPRPFLERRGTTAPLLTGQRVLDAVFPLVRGGTAAVPGGFGTGKTVLLQQIAKWCDADVIVYVGCGERGNEMADVLADFVELIDPRTGGHLVDRTVVIANTSNMPIMAREASIYTGVAVAEYYRDMGYDAVVIADSTSRWAEALREFASRSGALPTEEGYPAELASALAAFYERAGQVMTLGKAEASVSIIGAVSPPGGDMTEPVTSHTQRFVRSLWTLDRDLAYARHYPAVAWAGSYSRDADMVGAWYARNGDPNWARRRSQVVAMLAEADRLSALAELVGVGALPGHERMAMLGGRLLREGILQQSALSPTDAYCSPAKTTALIDMIIDVIGRCQKLVDGGVMAATVEEFDFSAALRAREDSGPDDAAAVRQRHEAILTELEKLT
jgi:V/A-type H+-transporting ATPase subunit A